eukprot:341291_1
MEILHLTLFYIVISNGNVNPTITNSTGEYYISSISGTFSNNNITCTSLICTILCDTTSSCRTLQIDASNANILNLHCNHNHSCYAATVTKGPSNLFNLDCTNEDSCRTCNFNADHTVSVHVTCDYAEYVGFQHGVCSYAVFNLQSSQNVAVYCGGWDSCYRAVFNINQTDISIFTSNTYGLRFSDIIGNGISTALNVSCHGNSCAGSKIYCPFNAGCNIYCVDGGNACYLAHFYIQSDTTPYFNLQCNTAMRSSCDKTSLHCHDTGLVTNYVYSGTTPPLFICETNDCCPTDSESTVNVLNCSFLFGNAVSCNIDCSILGCPFKTMIDASEASSLILTCDTDYECQHINIKCPNNGICDIKCLSMYSCEYMYFVKRNISAINLLCHSSYSCRYMFMNFNVANTANIECIGQSACGRSELSIVGTDNVTINVVCSHFQACVLSEFAVYGYDISFLCAIETLSCQGVSIIADIVNSLSIQTNDETAFELADIDVYCVNGLNTLNCLKNITFYCVLNAIPPTTKQNDSCINC